MKMDHAAFYSPHGFSFLRQDVSRVKQKTFIAFEKVASWFGGILVACSPSEAQCAVDLGIRQVRVVENGVDTEAIIPKSVLETPRVRVVTTGRICYQKAPWRLQQLALDCAMQQADFLWIGDGELRDTLKDNGRELGKVSVTGWLPRQQVYEEIARSDIFVLPSLWEGMPLALIEAQVAGLPAVVSDTVGNRDVIQNNITGFVCQSDAELASRLKLLINDASLRLRMGAAAREIGMKRFSMARLHREMLAVYDISTRSTGSMAFHP